MSCAGSGYLSGNMLVPFPIEDGQCLAWAHDAGEAQMALQRCIVDAGVYISGHSIPQGGWPSLAVLSLNGWRLRMKLRACGSEVEIVTDHTSEDAKGFPVYTGTAGWGSYMVVVSLEGIMDLISFCNKHSISPPAPGSSSPSGQDGGFWLRLCPKCVSVRPRQLESIRVLDGMNPPVFGRVSRGYSAGDICWHNGFHRCVGEVSEGSRWKASDWEDISISEFPPGFTVDGHVLVKPGNNMLLSRPDDVEGIGLNAMPGAGLGVISCGCSGRAEEISPIMSPDGQTRLFNDTCYDLEPAEFWTRTVDGEDRPSRNLKIHVKCTSCCTCEMYESIVNGRLKDLADTIRGAKSTLEGHLAVYEEAVDRFNRRITRPTVDDVSLSIAGMPIGHNVGSKMAGPVSGKMNRCAYTAIVRNSSYAVVTATVFALSGTDVVAEVSASWTDEDGNPKTLTGDSEEVVVNKSFKLPPGKTLAITFVSVKNDMVGSVSTGGYTGTIMVGLLYRTSDGKTGDLGILKKSVEV